jgi:LysR family transcriptional activator of nhaA
MSLNYKHLRYFWAVAHSGNLTRAAEQLFVSQSALSVQIRKLEEWLGHELFERQGKRLVLTEAGRIALDHADTIFGVGDELVSTLKGAGSEARQVLRVGALSTLSRNFQSKYLEPLFQRDDVLVVIRSGGQEKLLADLESHECDVVLTNVLPARDSGREWIVRALAEQPVSLIGYPDRVAGSRDLERLLGTLPLIVPTIENTIRIGFDALCDRLGLHPTLRAEVDDMALIRVLARANMGVAVIPPIVVRDELASGQMEELAQLSGLTETFYAITIRRKFPNPILSLLAENMEQQPEAALVRDQS